MKTHNSVDTSCENRLEKNSVTDRRKDETLDDQNYEGKS